MQDKLVFEAELDTSQIMRAFGSLQTEALKADAILSRMGQRSNLQQAFAQLATGVAGYVQEAGNRIKGLEKTVDEMKTRLAASSKAAGKAVGDGVASGVQESTGKVTSVVRAQAQWLQAAYEDELKKGIKFSSKDLMDFKAWGVNIGADARAGIHEGLLRAKSATPIDPRTLLGLTPDVMGKSAQASAEVFKEAFQAAALTASQRTRSASTIDPRVLLGLTPDVMTKSAKSSADVFKEAFQTEMLRAKASKAPDPRVLLGLTPDVMTKSAKASADVFKEAGLLDKATKDLTKSQGDLNDAFRSGHSAARGLASGMNMMWLTWGQLGPLLAGAALSNAFVQAIRLGSEFENTLAVIEHVGGQASAEVRQLGEAALSLSRVGPYGPNEVALALKTMALAGLDAKDSLAALKPMLDFALVGEMGVEKATESALAISKAFGYTAEGVSSVTDVIAKAAAVSMSSIGSMTEAFRQASTVAQQFGVSIKDASTTLALLSQVGIQGTAAGTAMRNMYTELLGMSKGARDILKNVLKLEVFDNAAKAMKPLSEILRDLSSSLKGMDFESQLRVLQKLGNERGLKALSADLVAFVTAAKGSGKDVVTVFEQIRREMDESAGFVALAAVNMSLTTSNQLKAVGSALQTTLVEAFLSVNTEAQRTAGTLKDAFNSKEFKDGVAGLVGSLATLVRFLLEHKDVLAAIGIGVVGGVAATAGFAMFGSLAAAIGAVATAAGIAAPALSLVLATLGPIGAVLGIATAAYVLFGRTAKSESERAAEAASTQYAATMEGIKTEQERLDKAIAATKAQLLGTDAVLKVEQETAIERTRILQNEQMEAEKTRHQHVLLNAQRTLGKIQGTEFENTAQGAAAVKQANEQVAASAAQVNETWRKQERQMGALVAGMTNIRRGATELANLQEQLAKKNANKPAGSGVYDPDAATKSAEKLERAYDSLLSSINEKIATQKIEIDVGRKASESDKLLIKFTEDLKDKYKGLAPEKRRVIEAAIAEVAANERVIKSTLAMVDAYRQTVEFTQEVEAAESAAFKTREQIILSTDAYGASIRTANEMIALEQSLFGKSEQDRATAIGQYQIELDLKKQIEAINNRDAVSSQEWRDEQIAKVTASAEEAKRGLAAKANLTEMQRLMGTFDNTAHDVFVNLFNDGSNAFKKLGQSLKAGLIDVLYQMTLKKWVFNIVGSVTGGGVAGAANAATSGLSGGSSLLSTGSNIYQLGSSVAGGMSMANATGSMLANATGAGLDGLLALNGAYGTASGMAGAMAPVLQGLMTAAPYLAAVAAVYMIAKSLDKSGTPHSGGGSAYSAASGLSSTPVGGWTGGTTWGDGFGSVMGKQDTTDMTAGLTQSIVGILDSTASAFGKQAGYYAATSFADDSSKDGAWGSLLLKMGDTVLTDWNSTRNSKWAPKVFSDGSAGSAEYLAAISADVRAALNGIGLPEWATAMLDKLGAAPALDQLANTVALINKTQAVFAGLGQAMAGFAAIGDVGRGRLVEAAGGIDALGASASAYYQAMYTEDEKALVVKRQYTEALQAVNLAVPTTIEAYRAQVAWHESIADTEPGAAKVLATLYAMGPAFASVNQPAAELADTVVDTVEEIATLGQELDSLRNPIRTIKDIAQSIFSLEKEGASLQVELLRTYGDSNSIIAANKLQRDIETAGMTAQEIALYDSNAARRAEIDTIIAGRQAIADGVASWEAYFDLFGSPAEKQARAKTRVQAVLPADVDTIEEYKGYVYLLTKQFGVGSSEVKIATDVARDFSVAFPAVAEVISTAVTAVTDLTAYQANFYTESERAGIAMDSLRTTFNALGLEMPTTNAGFRALVDAQDLTTASGITTFNTLMNVQGAFAQLYPLVEAVATAATVLTTDLAAFHSGFFTAAEQFTLSSDAMNASLTALGVTNLPTTNAEFRALALGIDTSTDSGKALFNGLMGLAGAFAQLHPLVTTVTEGVQTLDGAIASLRASGASRTVEQIASNMLTLEDQIFQLQNAGNTPALRQRTLEGLSDVKDSLTGLSERDLQNWVWSLQDAAQAVQDTAAANQTAADEMQRAAESAAAAAQRIASEHDGLWRQWLTLNGDTAALRALDLAALDPSNRALQQQIWALEDQKKAADEATAAAEQVKSAWASLTDSLLDEVRRIRGVIDESSGASYASLAAQFATATAQTRAGDQAAAKLLPGLSQSMLTAYESSASTLVDLQRVRALTANSLETTAGLASGVAPNGYGTAVLAPADAGPGTPAAQASTAAAAQTAELQGLRAEVAALRAALEAVVINTGKSTRLHQKWDDVGMPITTETDLAAVYGA